MNKSAVIGCVLFSLFLFASPAVAESPTSFVKGLVVDSRASIESKIDFEYVTREAMGSHWEEATETQRREVGGLLRKLMMRAVCRSFDEVKAHPVKYVGESLGPDESTVTLTTLPSPKDAYDPTELVFHLSPASENTMVRDVEVEGVSLIDSYRHQIHKVVVKNGIDAVVRKMRDRIQNPPVGC